MLSYLRLALGRADSADLSIRVNAFTRERAKLDAGIPVSPELLITVTDPSSHPGCPRLLAVEHERVVPHLKHTGTFPLVYFGRQAHLAGYDDALFYNRAGNVSEASIWNICFAADGGIVWPAAEVLPGITMLTLQAGLAATGVRSETVPVPLTAGFVRSGVPDQLHRPGTTRRLDHHTGRHHGVQAAPGLSRL